MPDITTAIDGLTYRLRRYRLHRWLGGRLDMGRLEDKLARVAGIAERATKDVEGRADAVLEREPQLLARSAHIFDAKNALLDDAEKALDRVERAMGLISNDPLQASGNSPEAAPPAAEPQPAPTTAMPDASSAWFGRK